MTTSTERKILEASLDAMRELTLEQLKHEGENIELNLRDAVQTAVMIIDFCIAEKLAKRALN